MINELHVAMGVARQTLAEANAIPADADPHGYIGSHAGLIYVLQRLVDAVDAAEATRSAARSQEFTNLARAARMEIHAARNCLKRLDGFERALTAIVWPEDEGGR